MSRASAAVALLGILATLLAALTLPVPSIQALELTGAAAGAAVGAGALGAVLLLCARRTTLATQAILVSLTPVAAVAGGAMAASHWMIASMHPTAALGVVLLASGTLGIVTSQALGARLRAGSERLITATRQIGGGDLGTTVDRPAFEELALLAAELEAMEVRLAESLGRERDLAEARHELVSWISHDLRTPVARMRAIAEALQDEIIREPDEVASYLAQLHTEADLLGELIADLFELNGIAAGELDLELQPTKLAEVVSDVVASFLVIAEARGLRLEAPAPTIDPEVRISPRHLERALGNLVDNALRHTGAGETVAVAILPHPSGVAVAVDDGCGGGDVAFLEELLSGPGTPRQLGRAGQTSLGLAIAKGLVGAQGGAIAVEGTPRGCRFTIVLPLARVECPERAPASTRRADTASRSAR
jgi:signal transduction histidine kinase